MSALDFMAAADNTNVKAGGTSFFDDPGTAIGGSVAGAVLSGIGSIYNTGVDVTNKLFGANNERMDVQNVLNSVDTKWGDYYGEHKDTIDTMGFIGTSFVPGGLAIKGLKLAQRGEAAGAFTRVLGYASSRQTYYLEKALQGVAEEGAGVFTQINTSKMASMAWGVADQALQTFAFETAVATTMKASPMLDNADLKDLGWDILKTTALGGAFGGGLEAIFTNGTIKSAAKLVDAKKREFDVLRSFDNTSLGLGDKAFSVIDAVLDLPKEVREEAFKVPIAYNSKNIPGFLNTQKLFEKTLSKTVDEGLQKFGSQITHAVKNDLTVGKPVAESMLDMVKQGMELGKTDVDIRQKMFTYLANLKSIEGIGTKSANLNADVLYLNPHAQVGDKAAKWMTPVKQTGDDRIYRVIGDEAAATQGVLGQAGLVRLDDAWKAGLDSVIDPATKTVHISPMSKIYQRISKEEAEDTALYYNTTSHITSADTVPTIADIAHPGEVPTVKADTVVAGNRSFRFHQSSASPAVDGVEASARHLWASEQKFISGNIEATDVSMMDAILQNPGRVQNDVGILVPGKGTVMFSEIGDFNKFAFDQKYARAIQLLEDAGPGADLRETALKLNVTPQWLDKAVSTKFDMKSLYNDPGWSRKLEGYANRENVILRYNTAGMEQSTFVSDAVVAYRNRVTEAVQKCKDMSKAVLGEDYDLLLDLKDSLARDATQVGNGASLLGASNADYFDKLAVWAQSTGAAVSKIATNRTEAALGSIQNAAAKLLQNPDAAADITAATTKVRTSTDPLSLFQDPATGNWMLVDTPSFVKAREVTMPTTGISTRTFETRIPLSDEAGEFLNIHHQLHQTRVEQYKALGSAQGTSINWDTNRLYVPPVDTRRVPFFAFVRQSDGTMFGSSEVGMITARDSSELARLTAAAEKEKGIKVIYKKDTEDYFKAKGDYDFQRALNNPTLDPMLRSKKLLGDYLPSFQPKDTVEDYITYISRQETKIVRDAVSVNYAQTVAELQGLSAKSTALQTSKFEGFSKLLARNVVDPFGDYLKTALNISKRGEFTLWHQANEFVDAVGTKAYRGIEKALVDSQEGRITWEQANDKLEDFGIGRHFTDKEAFDVAQTTSDRNIIKLALNKANMLLANGLLRLDFANSLMNMVSTPILLGTEVASIRRSLKNDPEMFASFNKQLQLAVPGAEGISVPSTTRLLFKSVANSIGEGSKELWDRYKKIGAIKDQGSLFHEMVEDLSLTPKLIPTKYAETVDKWVEKGASLTFNNQAESITRFVSADVMRQITQPLVDAGKMVEKEQNAFINIFVNRVQGNYIASQRPILFQGTMGSAIGLFQTYQFNLFQQLFRHIENKDAKTIAVMAGLQGSFFGLNGLPMFDAINTQIVGGANINAKHKDAYTFAVQAAGKDVGDWLLYGTPSAFPMLSGNMPALYTRGDLNPRNAFIVPTSPAEVPAVAAAGKVVQTLVGMGERIAAGGSLTGSLLYGLEHNGLNRPLAGLAQVFSGRATTQKGDLISSSSDLASIATFSRLIGSRPMDESIGLNMTFRNKAYEAMDKSRIEVIGAAVKEKMRNNQPLSTEDWVDFQGKYAAAGGRIEGYSAALQRWSRSANNSIINEAMRHNQTASGQRLMEVMGGSKIEDFANPASFDE